MKKFLLSLLDASDPHSSKRFAGLVVLATTIILAIIATIKNSGICPMEMFNALLLFAAGVFGINGMEAIFRKDAPLPTQTTDKTTDDKDKSPEIKVDEPS